MKRESVIQAAPPQQEVASSPPTHAFWRADGSVEIVYPVGYPRARLTRLPKGYSEETHRPDAQARKFVLVEAVAAEPPASAAAELALLKDRIAALEAQLAIKGETK